MKKVCEHCGTDFHSNLKFQKYCGSHCSTRNSTKKYKKTTPRQDISTTRSGAASELLVAADLLIKGYEVFRAFSADASCDLIAMKESTIQRIQVKTVSRKIDGSIPTHLWEKEKGRCDLFAVVANDNNEIIYLPA